jgi:hypothetical protein
MEGFFASSALTNVFHRICDGSGTVIGQFDAGLQAASVACTRHPSPNRNQYVLFSERLVKRLLTLRVAARLGIWDGAK